MLTLFVGGSHDGARLEIDEARKEVRLPVIESFAMGSITVETKEADIFKHEMYRRARLRGETEQFEIFVVEPMTPDDMIRALVYGYRRK